MVVGAGELSPGTANKAPKVVAAAVMVGISAVGMGQRVGWEETWGFGAAGCGTFLVMKGRVLVTGMRSFVFVE